MNSVLEKGSFPRWISPSLSDDKWSATTQPWSSLNSAPKCCLLLFRGRQSYGKNGNRCTETLCISLHLNVIHSPCKWALTTLAGIVVRGIAWPKKQRMKFTKKELNWTSEEMEIRGCRFSSSTFANLTWGVLSICNRKQKKEQEWLDHMSCVLVPWWS